MLSTGAVLGTRRCVPRPTSHVGLNFAARGQPHVATALQANFASCVPLRRPARISLNGTERAMRRPATEKLEPSAAQRSGYHRPLTRSSEPVPEATPVAAQSKKAP